MSLTHFADFGISLLAIIAEAERITLNVLFGDPLLLLFEERIIYFLFLGAIALLGLLLFRSLSLLGLFSLFGLLGRISLLGLFRILDQCTVINRLYEWVVGIVAHYSALALCRHHTGDEDSLCCGDWHLRARVCRALGGFGGSNSSTRFPGCYGILIVIGVILGADTRQSRCITLPLAV